MWFSKYSNSTKREIRLMPMYKNYLQKGVLHKEMNNQCYYCERVFDTKEKLFDHLEVHSKTIEEEHKKERKKK